MKWGFLKGITSGRNSALIVRFRLKGVLSVSRKILKGPSNKDSILDKYWNITLKPCRYFGFDEKPFKALLLKLYKSCV